MSTELMKTTKDQKTLSLVRLYAGAIRGTCIDFDIYENLSNFETFEADEEDCMNIVKCIMETYPHRFCKKVFKKQ